MRGETLIATLGVKPSVVTLACDLLLHQGVPLDEVVVIHTAASQPVIQNALTQLQEEFPDCRSYRHTGRPCVYRTVEVRDERGVPIDEPLDEWQTGALYRTIYREILRVKQQLRRVQFCIAGGRKSMSVYGMACAQMLFSPDDRLWHLLSKPEFEDSNALHCARPDDARLIRIPFLTLGFPFNTLIATEDPYRAVQEQQTRTEQTQKENARRFYEQELNESERAVVRAMMELYWEGAADATSKLISKRVNLSYRTVDNYFINIYDKLRNFQGIRDGQRLSRATLVAFIALYYTDPQKFKY